MVRVAVARVFALTVIICVAAFASGCDRGGCENAILCVEQCFTPIFRQCAGCPPGSFEEARCDRQSVCVRDLERPAGPCDPASCTAGDNGRCVPTPAGDSCSYDECGSDADCPMGSLCACNAGILEANVCVPASCARPEDCGDYPCSPVAGCGGPNDPVQGGPLTLACHGPDDECYDDRQCPEGQFCTMRVSDPVVEPGPWVCTDSFCE
jgi:hypothetical protein